MNFFRRRIPAEEWKQIMKDQKLKRKFPSNFLFARRTCGMCEDGVKFQFVWRFEHEGFGSDLEEVFSCICKKCAPTREQLIFISLNFEAEKMTTYVNDLGANLGGM